MGDKNIQTSEVEDFDPDFFRPCIFPILTDLGYTTTLSINNGLSSGEFSETMDISVTFLSDQGEILGRAGVGELQPGEMKRVDTNQLLAKIGLNPEGNTLGVAHVVPRRFAGQARVTISRQDQMAHVGASDDFVEFRQEPKGVITGVAYQMGPQNDFRFNKTRTTLLQAPKVIVSEAVDTLFAVINASTSFDYQDIAHLEYWIFGPSGNKIAKGSIEVPPWTVRFISATETLEACGEKTKFITEGGLGMVLGLSRDSGLVPISMTRNLRSGAIACDHTLPPVYYFSTWGGQVRLEANSKLYEIVFSGGIGV
jgi:hypothetical protein